MYYKEIQLQQTRAEEAPLLPFDIEIFHLLNLNWCEREHIFITKSCCHCSVMKRGLSVGLSLVFVFLLLALLAQVYCLVRWKKYKTRIISQEEDQQKKPQSLHHKNEKGREAEISKHSEEGNPDLELGFEAEEELMKFYNQRLLFTIMEETKADLESDDGRSRFGSRSRRMSSLTLSDVLNDPGFTPLASPITLKSSPLGSYDPHHGLDESDGELEFNRLLRSPSSPPPKFKFMRDAEEKLRKKMIEEAKRRDKLAEHKEGYVRS